MGDTATIPWIDYPSYLERERSADQRHEWLEGRVYAMAGGTLAHAELSAAMTRELGRMALPCGCRVYSADARVRVRATGLATHPDVSVVCGAVETDAQDANALANPSLLVEVLSDGTAGYDRGEKFEHYQRIESLRDYVLVSQHQRRVEVYSRDTAQRWVLRIALAGELVPLTAMPGVIEVDRVYDGVALVPAPLLPVRSG